MNAFTLLETIIATGIFCLACIILTSSLLNIKELNRSNVRSDQMKWEQFRAVIENNSLDFQFKGIDNRKRELTLYSKKECSNYQLNLYKQSIRMKRNNTGYIPLLYGVKNVSWNYNKAKKLLIISVWIHDRQYVETYIMEQDKDEL